MNGQEPSRRRAVQLTPEALNNLKCALSEKWHLEERPGKLTREARAEILGISIATAERVLTGKGVDRPTLTLAFRNVGLSWHESYCEFVTKHAPVENGSTKTHSTEDRSRRP